MELMVVAFIKRQLEITIICVILASKYKHPLFLIFKKAVHFI